MTDRPHHLVRRPAGPDWCFCGRPSCPAWAAYRNWHLSYTGTEPDEYSISRDRAALQFNAALTARYRQIFGHHLFLPAAYDLYSWEMEVNQAAGLGDVAVQLFQTPAPPGL